LDEAQSQNIEHTKTIDGLQQQITEISSRVLNENASHEELVNNLNTQHSEAQQVLKAAQIDSTRALKQVIFHHVYVVFHIL